MTIRTLLLAGVSFIALAGCQPKEEAAAPETAAPADMSAPLTPATTDQAAPAETGK